MLLAATMFFPERGHAQIDIEKLVVRENIHCQDIAISATKLIPALHQDNKIDTLYALLYYWDLNCGLAEPLLRFYLLDQIEYNRFDDTFYPDQILTFLEDFRKSTSFENPNFYLDYYAWEYYEVDSTYSAFSKNLALYLQRYSDLQPIELFFLEYYSHDFDRAMERLKSGELAGTRLDSLYNAKIEIAKKAKRVFINLYGGLWKPNGDLALLGSHPEIGFGGGFIQQGFLMELIFKIGFGPSPNYYEVVVDNLGYRTKSFTNVHVSGRIGLVPIDINRHQLLLSVGLGYEGIQAFSTTEQEEEGLSRMISSASFSPGVEFRFPVSEASYLGLNFRYNFLNFSTRRNETPLNGNALMFGISWGFDDQ
ncbi:MAG: hypothetical protein K0B09_04220 [Bacteroidales bacterium]|nr:hypothetical protein [Bacteroidales bacterium]